MSASPLLGCILLSLVITFISVVNAEASALLTLRRDFRRPFPLYDATPNCIDRKEYNQVHSAASSEKKDIDIIVTYIDPLGTVRVRTKKSKDLSSSWVWKYPSPGNHDLALSSHVIGHSSQHSRRLNESEHHWGKHNYDSGTPHPIVSPLHPLKLKRRMLRQERREQRAAGLMNQSKEIDNQMQEAAIVRTSELDTTVKGKYGIWRKEYDSPNADAMLKLIRDQIILARAYATIAKAENETDLYDSLLKLSRESRLAVGDATSDAELQPSALDQAIQMGHTLSRAKVQLYDCMTMARKLRVMLQSTEDSVSGLKKKSGFLIQLAAKTVPSLCVVFPCYWLQIISNMAMRERSSPTKKNLKILLYTIMQFFLIM